MGSTLWALNYMTSFMDALDQGVAICNSILGFILLFVAKSSMDAANRTNGS